MLICRYRKGRNFNLWNSVRVTIDLIIFSEGSEKRFFPDEINRTLKHKKVFVFSYSYFSDGNCCNGEQAGKPERFAILHHASR